METFRKVEHTIYNEKVNDDIKIISISDLHYTCDINEDLLLNLFEKISKEEPNYICICGDIIDSANETCSFKNADSLFNFIESLGTICPVIIGLGNHDIAYYDGEKWEHFFNQDFFCELNHIDNVNVLHNAFYEDKNILIAGYTQPFDYYYSGREERSIFMKRGLSSDSFQNIETTHPKVMLLHSPLCVLNNDIQKLLKDYDLVLSGHTHEGLIPKYLCDFVSGNTGLISPSKKLFPKNARGTIKFDDNYLIISGGITKLPKSTGLLRGFNWLYPVSIDSITLSNNKDKIEYKRRVKYYK